MAVSQIAASASNADVPDNDYISTSPCRSASVLIFVATGSCGSWPAGNGIRVHFATFHYGIQLAFREFVPRKA